MHAYLELGALVLQVVFLAGILSVIGWGVNRLIESHSASRQSLTKNPKKVSHADAARARAQARATARQVTTHSF